MILRLKSWIQVTLWQISNLKTKNYNYRRLVVVKITMIQNPNSQQYQNTKNQTKNKRKERERGRTKTRSKKVNQIAIRLSGRRKVDARSWITLCCHCWFALNFHCKRLTEQRGRKCALHSKKQRKAHRPKA